MSPAPTATSTGASAAPFLVVTPLGLQDAGALADALAEAGIRLGERRTLRPWSRAATALYARSDDSALAQRFEERWRTLFPAERAEHWLLAGNDDYGRLCAHKAALRLRFPGCPLEPRAHGRPSFSLHAFHVPDPDHVGAETRNLAAYLA
ncbi:MAG: hypothetical protein R3F56_04785 [Planctomycetota bacterium]